MDLLKSAPNAPKDWEIPTKSCEDAATRQKQVLIKSSQAFLPSPLCSRHPSSCRRQTKGSRDTALTDLFQEKTYSSYVFFSVLVVLGSSRALCLAIKDRLKQEISGLSGFLTVLLLYIVVYCCILLYIVVYCCILLYIVVNKHLLVTGVSNGLQSTP